MFGFGETASTSVPKPGENVQPSAGGTVPTESSANAATPDATATPASELPQSTDPAVPQSVPADLVPPPPAPEGPVPAPTTAGEMPKAAVYNVYTVGGQLKRAFDANEFGTSERALKAAQDYARPLNMEVRPG